MGSGRPGAAANQPTAVEPVLGDTVSAGTLTDERAFREVRRQSGDRVGVTLDQVMQLGVGFRASPAFTSARGMGVATELARHPEQIARRSCVRTRRRDRVVAVGC